MNQLSARLGLFFRDPRWFFVVVVAGLTWVSLVVMRDTGPSAPAPTEAAGFALTPDGEDVPRLAPIKVTFAKAPSDRDGANLLQVEPAPQGKYAWLSDRTLLFQPEYPGLLRGQTYTVEIPARPRPASTRRSRSSSPSPAC